MFPLGLLTVVVLLDAFQLLGGPRLLGALAYCTLAAGLVGGAVTAVAVWVHGMAAAQPDAARPVHRFLLDGTVLIAFAVILMLRLRTPERTVGPGLLVLELVGLAPACLGALRGAAPPEPATAGADTVRLADLFPDQPEARR